MHRVRAMTADDTARCGTICYEAFREVAVRHHFPPDFSRPEDAIELVASLHANNKFFSVLAESDGCILGSNFLDERSTIFSVGPITVAPRSRDHRVGHALLTAVLARSEHLGAPGVRLVQAGYNTRSMSLYTKLGFRVRAPLAVVQVRPLARSADGFDVRMATEADLARCDEFCTEVHGHHRTGELREAIANGSARVVIRRGRITGYTTGIGFAWALRRDEQRRCQSAHRQCGLLHLDWISRAARQRRAIALVSRTTTPNRLPAQLDVTGLV